MSIRPVLEARNAVPTMEGAGVHLHRAFGFHDPSELDPFLLFDDFRNEIPAHYAKGFPWHPHRGIETITYVLSGEVDHADSLGNTGRLGAGDVQWMTAGSGIMHQEMPRGNASGQMHGFQLWANLPRDLKMTDPRYQDVAAKEIPEIIDDDGTRVRVVTGEFWGKRGPVAVSQPTRNTSMYSCQQASKRPFLLIHTAALLPMFLKAKARSLMPLRPLACFSKKK